MFVVETHEHCQLSPVNNAHLSRVQGFCSQDEFAFHPEAIGEAWHISVLPAIDESFNSRGMLSRAAASD